MGVGHGFQSVHGLQQRRRVRHCPSPSPSTTHPASLTPHPLPESSLLEMSFNSPVHCGMRRSPSAVFARAQRDIHRPAMTPEEAGDIAQVPTCLVVCVAHGGPSPCGVLPVLSEHSAASLRLGGKGVDGMSVLHVRRHEGTRAHD